MVRRVFETNVRLDSSNYSKLAYSPKLFISNPPNLKFCVNYRNKGLSFQHIQVRIIPFENIVCIITIFPLKVYDTKGISLTSYHKNVNFVFWKYEFCLCLYHCFIAWNKDMNIEMSLTFRFIFSRKICTIKLNHICLFTYESRGIKYLKHQANL